MKEGKVIFTDTITGESIIGILKKDNKFWGGYKIEYEQSIVSINIVKGIIFLED